VGWGALSISTRGSKVEEEEEEEEEEEGGVMARLTE
jgi:hypothetical protein